MGNHEFCVECGESDFHYGQLCNPEKKAAYQRSLLPRPQRDISQARARIANIREAELVIQAQTDRLLREAGWEYRCDYPGAFWLWEKLLPNGRTVAVSADHALAIQRAMDEAAGLYDDGEGEE